MHFCRNDVFSAPTSFLALVSLTQAVRLACFAAASPEGGAGAAGMGFAGDGVPGAGVSARCVGGAAANPPTISSRQRHTAAATDEKRMYLPQRITAAGRRSW